MPSLEPRRRARRLEDSEISAGLRSQVGKYSGAGINGWLEQGATRIDDLSSKLDNAVHRIDVLHKQLKEKDSHNGN